MELRFFLKAKKKVVQGEKHWHWKLVASRLSLSTDKLRQNISNKIEKSSKTELENKNLISTFACFLTAIAKA